ncbi:chemotaxis protein CheA [Halobacillus sp. BBL2006]|uniref:chemotaxis protein CheA n=1 Tax=Halobacillus sp. BBL2006 TaxID=1543706 RepID=UPI00054374E9|nr:chemotaxis protein CheA [Halobacillus sp. BBL2006]KHE71276.1 chemotaxis protein CheA [Halobacillus sp. BBL2006]
MESNPYLEVFIDESKEHLQAINDNLLELEKNPKDLTIVSEIFRSAHTLKGMSATMGYQDLSNLTHIMENVLDGVRNEKINVDGEMIDVVFDSMDDLEAMVMDIAEGGSGKRNVKKVVQLLEAIESGEIMETSSSSKDSSVKLHKQMKRKLEVDEFTLTVLQQSQEQGQANYMVEVRLREDCLLKAARVYMVFEVLEQLGEVIQSQPSVEQLENEEFDTSFSILLITAESKKDVSEKINKVSEIENVEVEEFSIEDYMETYNADASPKDDEVQEESERSKLEDKQNTRKHSKGRQARNKTIRINIDRLDLLMNLFEEFVIDRGRLKQVSNDLKHDELQETVERMTRVSADLQSIILNMRMVPVETVINRFPRMVRQLSRDLNKEIDLNIVGAETELDRTVIDEIGDPLVHLIRNAVDHGVESPEERKAKGKPATGTLELKAYHSGNHVFIEISDDGNGIDREKVMSKAISNGVVTKEQALNMTDIQMNELIMESGFSTADTISDVSGRGVGMDVVKNTIESLGGTITIESELNQGSTFCIQLPLTLSIISVMLVEVQKEKYAVPLSSIIETAIVKKEDVLHAHNKQVIDYRGKVVPLIFLKDILEVPQMIIEEDYYSLIIVRKGDKMAAFVVDSFIGQQEVVLKSLGDYLSGVFAISGATILGDGQVALILDSNALIK